jgi:hypothetical protein
MILPKPKAGCREHGQESALLMNDKVVETDRFWNIACFILYKMPFNLF